MGAKKTGAEAPGLASSFCLMAGSILTRSASEVCPCLRVLKLRFRDSFRMP
jgi:hypothetical protein